MAVRTSWSTLRLNLSLAKARNFFKSVFDIPPIGLMSADEQSYFVIYPLRASSTLAEPRTSKPKKHNILKAGDYDI